MWRTQSPHEKRLRSKAGPPGDANEPRNPPTSARPSPHPREANAAPPHLQRVSPSPQDTDGAEPPHRIPCFLPSRVRTSRRRSRNESSSRGRKARRARGKAGRRQLKDTGRHVEARQRATLTAHAWHSTSRSLWEALQPTPDHKRSGRKRRNSGRSQEMTACVRPKLAERPAQDG